MSHESGLIQCWRGLPDDEDYEFKGKGTRYWICEKDNCDGSMEEIVRYSQVIRREYFYNSDIQKIELVPWVLPTDFHGNEFD